MYWGSGATLRCTDPVAPLGLRARRPIWRHSCVERSEGPERDDARTIRGARVAGASVLRLGTSNPPRLRSGQSADAPHTRRPASRAALPPTFCASRRTAPRTASRSDHHPRSKPAFRPALRPTSRSAPRPRTPATVASPAPHPGLRPTPHPGQRPALHPGQRPALHPGHRPPPTPASVPAPPARVAALLAPDLSPGPGPYLGLRTLNPERRSRVLRPARGPDPAHQTTGSRPTGRHASPELCAPGVHPSRLRPRSPKRGVTPRPARAGSLPTNQSPRYPGFPPQFRSLRPLVALASGPTPPPPRRNAPSRHAEAEHPGPSQSRIPGYCVLGLGSSVADLVTGVRLMCQESRARDPEIDGRQPAWRVWHPASGVSRPTSRIRDLPLAGSEPQFRFPHSDSVSWAFRSGNGSVPASRILGTSRPYTDAHLSRSSNAHWRETQSRPDAPLPRRAIEMFRRSVSQHWAGPLTMRGSGNPLRFAPDVGRAHVRGMPRRLHTLTSAPPRYDTRGTLDRVTTAHPRMFHVKHGDNASAASLRVQVTLIEVSNAMVMGGEVFHVKHPQLPRIGPHVGTERDLRPGVGWVALIPPAPIASRRSSRVLVVLAVESRTLTTPRVRPDAGTTFDAQRSTPRHSPAPTIKRRDARCAPQTHQRTVRELPVVLGSAGRSRIDRIFRRRRTDTPGRPAPLDSPGESAQAIAPIRTREARERGTRKTEPHTRCVSHLPGRARE